MVINIKDLKKKTMKREITLIQCNAAVWFALFSLLYCF